MDRAYHIPTLTDSDALYSIAQWSRDVASALGQNTGWTALPIQNTAYWGPVTNYPMQVKRAGHVVQVRGILQTKSTSLAGVFAVQVPSGLGPSTPVFQSGVLSGGMVTMPLLDTTGAIIPFVGGYYGGIPAVGSTVAINLTYILG